jgi:hypothetical protein
VILSIGTQRLDILQRTLFILHLPLVIDIYVLVFNKAGVVQVILVVVVVVISDLLFLGFVLEVDG